MKLSLFAIFGLTASSNGQTTTLAPSVSKGPSLSSVPSVSTNPSKGPSLSSVPSLSTNPSSGPSLSINPSNGPSLSSGPSHVPSLSMNPSNVPSTSPAPSIAATSIATLASTERCTEFCAKSGVTTICGGAVTGSYCALVDDSGDALGTSCKKEPRCTCICPDGDLYYAVDSKESDSDDSDDEARRSSKGFCGRNPDCEKGDDFFDDICFSPIATVSVSGKGRVMMKDLANGDNVLTMDGSYQTMYSMNHYHASKETTFVQIKTNLELEQPLELSPKHLLYLADNTNPVPASTVEVGDKVWTLEGGKEVLEINMITRGGLYNPLTMDGTIVVDGIAASVYTTPSGKAHLEIEGVWSKMMNSLSFHDALHMVSAPYRQFCSVVSIDLCNSHEKESAASSFMKTFFFSFFSNQNDFGKFIVASLYVLVFGTLANLTYFKVWFLLANASAFITILSKMTRTKKATAKTISA